MRMRIPGSLRKMQKKWLNSCNFQRFILSLHAECVRNQVPPWQLKRASLLSVRTVFIQIWNSLRKMNNKHFNIWH